MKPLSFIPTSAERERIEHIANLRATNAVEPLIAMLNDPSWLVRRAVVEAVAHAPIETVARLCHILTDARDSEARLAATADALVQSIQPVEAEVSRLATHADPAVVADVVQVLSRRRRSVSIPVLIELTRHENDNVAVGAIEALGHIGSRSAVEALIDIVGQGNFFRTFPAIDVLGRSADPRAIEPLSQLLANPNYRPEAARALGRSGERAALPALLELLRSPSDSVIRLSVHALSELRERYEEKTGESAFVIDELVRAQTTAETSRRLSRVLNTSNGQDAVLLCRWLGYVGQPDGVEALTRALDAEKTVAAAAAAALKKIGQPADDQILLALQEGSSDRRRALLPTIGRVSAAPAVEACLDDDDGEVRALACECLARIGSVSSVAKLFACLADSNLRLVHAATAAIQSLGTREARQRALEASRSSQLSTRRAALRIVSYFGDDTALEPLLEAARHGDARLYEIALQGLALLDDPRARAAIYRETQNELPRMRALAYRSLGQRPAADDEGYALLVRGLRDPDPWSRYYACQSLGRLRLDRATTAIAGLLDDEAGQVRVSAVEALSHFENDEAQRALAQAARAADLDVRRAALVGLGLSHRESDLKIVIEATRSPDLATRLIALSAAVNFGSAEVLPALKEAASDTDEQVRSTAIGFLALRPEAEASEILLDLLGRPDTKAAARTGLLEPKPHRVPALLTRLHRASEEEAPDIVALLTRINRPDAKSALVSAMHIPNAAARKATATALAARSDRSAREVLREAALNDPDPAVRSICALSLSE